MNCILCDKPSDWDICAQCQADGIVHPIPTKAWTELKRREATRKPTPDTLKDNWRQF